MTNSKRKTKNNHKNFSMNLSSSFIVPYIFLTIINVWYFSELPSMSPSGASFFQFWMFSQVGLPMLLAMLTVIISMAFSRRNRYARRLTFFVFLDLILLTIIPMLCYSYPIITSLIIICTVAYPAITVYLYFRDKQVNPDHYQNTKDI